MRTRSRDQENDQEKKKDFRLKNISQFYFQPKDEREGVIGTRLPLENPLFTLHLIHVIFKLEQIKIKT